MNDAPKNPHLEYEISERGFIRMPIVDGTYNDQVSVYESSSAEGPHIWLKTESPTNPNYPDGARDSAYVHLTLEEAKNLADQINFLVEHHYQVSMGIDRP